MEETSSDVKWFDVTAANSSKYQEEANINAQSPNVRFDPDSPFYDMSGDKFLIIFNHYLYQRTKYFKYQQPSTRTGTHADVDRLEKVFGNLDFKVTVHQDLTHEGIIKEVSTFCRWDHTNTSCVCVAILTHGDTDGDLFAADRPYKLSDVTTMFQNAHYGLVTKPKLFFVQACRGANMDAGRSVQFDGEGRSGIQVSSHADFLILHSSVDGEGSYDPGPLNVFTSCYGFVFRRNFRKGWKRLRSWINNLANKKAQFPELSVVPGLKRFLDDPSLVHSSGKT